MKGKKLKGKQKEHWRFTKSYLQDWNVEDDQKSKDIHSMLQEEEYHLFKKLYN